MQKLICLKIEFCQKNRTILAMRRYFQTHVVSLMKMNRRVAETGIFV